MFHLIIVAILMLSKISAIVQQEARILIDFSVEEQIEIIEKLEQVRLAAQEQLDELLAGTPSVRQEIRNVAVNASELRDDRNTDARELYSEAQRVQDRLDAARNAMQNQGENSEQSNEAALFQAGGGENAEAYRGPSVISYDLGGRRATRLPVPVYQCSGGGDVMVLIEVNRRGVVTSANIQTANSENNSCLHEAARRAALSSRFAVDSKAPEPQKGNIVYRFIAQ